VHFTLVKLGTILINLKNIEMSKILSDVVWNRKTELTVKIS